MSESNTVKILTVGLQFIGGIAITVSLGLSSWTLLKIIDQEGRIIRNETYRETQKIRLEKIEQKIDKLIEMGERNDKEHK